jgi:hypothetical protein
MVTLMVDLYFDLDADVSDTTAAMLNFGCLVLRNAVDADWLPLLYDASQRLFENDTNEYSPGDVTRHRGACNGRFLAKWAFGDEDIITKLLMRPRLADHLRNMLGEPPCLHPLYNVRYRSPSEPATALPFHQHPHHAPDGELSAERTRLIGISIPFAPYDGSRSDLELVPISLNELFPITQTPETQFGSFELDRHDVMRRFGNKLWRPRLQLGDIILFRECTLHRSYVTSDMPNARASVDVRIFGATDPITVFRGADGILLPDLQRIRAPV